MDVKAKLDDLGLTTENAVVIGSGAMGAWGIRLSKDIDLAVDRAAYERLFKDPRLGPVQDHGREILAGFV